MFWRAFLSKSGTFMRLFHTLQDKTTDAQGGLLRIDLFHFEDAFRIVGAKLVLQLVPTLRNRAHSAPLPVANLEDLIDQPLSRYISIAGNNPAVLVLYVETAGFELLHGFQNTFQQICRFKAGDHDRNSVAGADRFV